MSASPVVISQKPILANADTLVHTANNLRRITDTIGAVGVFDLESWRVRQQVSGAAMSVDVTTAAVASQAFIRGASTNLQGLYLVTNVAQGTGTIDALYNVNIAASDPTNPRIDQVFLCVEDAQHAGANTQATIRVVAGTPTGGATLDNRTGVGAAPAGMSSILLADILVAAAVGTILTAAIRDRRPVANFGTVPWLGSTGTQIDAVAFEAHPSLRVGSDGTQAGASTAAGTTDLLQSAALFWLPRRVASATKIRWRYRQGATACATNYVLWVADASGRVIAQTAATAFTGALNTYNEVSVALTATTTFEAGWYYVGIGIATMTASSSVTWDGVMVGAAATASIGNGPPFRNLAVAAAAGGTTVPTTILALVDPVTLTANTIRINVPFTELSVT